MKITASRILGAAGCAALLVSWTFAAEPTPLATTLMTERGKVVFADDFTQPPEKQWRLAKGKWQIKDGVLTGAEVKADMHGAAARHMVPFRNSVVQFSFKLDGAKKISLSYNDDKGHICRVLIDSAGFIVKKDSHDHNKTDKGAILDQVKTPIKTGEWHTMAVEIYGNEMLAVLDGKVAGFGTHPGIDVKMANVGLTVAGESASFKNLTIWEATPSSAWAATKAKLLTSRPALP